MSVRLAAAHENPFRTARLAGLTFRFPQGWDMERLLERLREAGGRGAIVGPRGSGKTTLLGELAVELRGRGLRVVSLRMGRKRPLLPAAVIRRAAQAGAVLVDGAERLGPLGRYRLLRRLRRVPVLVITAHRPGLLPTLLATSTDPALLADLVAELAPGAAGSLAGELTALHRRCGGDLHRAFLELYDRAAGRASGRAGPIG